MLTDLGTFGLPVYDFAVQGDMAYGTDSFRNVNALTTLPDAGTYTRLYGDDFMGVWLSFQLDANNGVLDGLEGGNGVIDRVALDGGVQPSVTIDADALMMAVRDDTLYWVDVPSCVTHSTPDCQTSLHTSALDGSNPTLVASGAWPIPNNAGYFGAITSSYVFLLVEGGVLRVTLATGESHMVYLAPEGDAGPSVAPQGSIAADEQSLYVTDPIAGLSRIAN